MTIVNVGVSHHSAPAGVLEKLAVLPGEQAGVLARLHAIPGIDEVFILSTCNRVEVYAATQRPTEEITQAVAEMLASRGRTRVSDLLRLARLHVAAAAAEHLFSVTSGLESMAVGEEQIVAQVKAAARDATAAGTTGPVLTGLVDAALRASKRVRSESGIGTAGASLVRAGLSLAREHLGGEPSGCSAVVVGTGSVGKLAARLLREAKVEQLSIISRTPARAAELAAATGGLPLLLATLPVAISDADVLVAATGASAPTVLAQEVRAARKTIGHRPLFVLDLGMPPDVEREVGELPGVRLVDLAALGRHLATAGTQDRIPRARAVVSAEAAAYLVRQQQVVAAPVIAALHDHIRQVADAELARLQGRLRGLDARQRAEITASMHRILRKILHSPTVRAKEFSAGPEGPVYLEVLRQLFDLPAPAPGSPPTRR